MHAVQGVALLIPTDFGGNRLLSCLDTVPQNVVDDAQLGGFDNLPPFLRVD
ncbi:hypothetical protein FBZ83_1342 [Azospirillum brasilense]|uniref:Uncharacterized protein n=2 Tax=Azospirillum brasilense TaxID=192 RepID=A0A560BLL8_AZOBR|nr:hypothetical protein FBZ83_1342 [Azospirillum brasilense]